MGHYKVGLTRRKTALVSAEDFVEMSRHKWCVSWRPTTKRYYAKRKCTDEGGRSITVYMHRQVMGFPDGLQIDHINGNTLDNRRENLRIATSKENKRNSRVRSTNRSGFKGVARKKNTRLWRASIGVDGSHIHLGYFTTPEEAHAAYCEAAKKYHGQFARVA